MSEVENQDNVQSDDQGNAGQPDKANDSVKYDTYSRVVGKHKKLQSEAEDMRAKLAEYEQAGRINDQNELASKGQYEEALKRQTDETNRFRDLAEEKDRNYAFNNLKYEVKGELRKSGCLDNAIDDSFELIAGNSEYVESLSWDDKTNFKINKQSVEEVVNRFKVSKSYFFAAKQGTIEDGTPGRKFESGTDTSSMTNAQKKDSLWASMEKDY